MCNVNICGLYVDYMSNVDIRGLYVDIYRLSPQCPGTQLQHDNQPERHEDLVQDNHYKGHLDAVGDDCLCLHGHQWCPQHRAGSPQSGGWLRGRQSDPGEKSESDPGL